MVASIFSEKKAMIKHVSFCYVMGFFLYFSDISADTIPIGETAAHPMHVVDDNSLVKLGEQAATLNKSLAEMQKLHKDLNANLSGLLSVNGMPIGSLYNKNAQEAWQWTASDWQKTLEGMVGGNNQRYKDLLNAYKKQYPALSEEIMKNDYHVSPSQRNIYQNGVKTNAVVLSESAYQYNDINKHMQEIQELSEYINHATTDKEATDLNSKLLAQLAYVQLAALRMQTLTNQQLGEQRAATLAAEKQHIEFTSHEITN
jgi:type IV secretion system protein VirB5